MVTGLKRYSTGPQEGLVRVSFPLQGPCLPELAWFPGGFVVAWRFALPWQPLLPSPQWHMGGLCLFSGGWAGGLCLSHSSCVDGLSITEYHSIVGLYPIDGFGSFGFILAMGNLWLRYQPLLTGHLLRPWRWVGEPWHCSSPLEGVRHHLAEW